MALVDVLQSTLVRHSDLVCGRVPHTQRWRYTSQPNLNPSPSTDGHDPQYTRPCFVGSS